MSKFNLSLAELNRLIDGLCDTQCIRLNKCQADCNVVMVDDSDGELIGELRDGFYYKLDSMYPYTCDNCQKLYCEKHAVRVIDNGSNKSASWICFSCEPK